MKIVRFEMLYPSLAGLQWEHSLEGCCYILVHGYTFPYRGDVTGVTNVFQYGDSYLILSRNIDRKVARLDVYEDSQVKFTIIVDNSARRYSNRELVTNLSDGWDSDPRTIAESLYNAHPLLRV